jgi:FAD/FMN-containing dehydrogenase
MSDKKRNYFSSSNRIFSWDILLLLAVLCGVFYQSGGYVAIVVSIATITARRAIYKAFPASRPVAMMTRKEYERYVEDAQTQMRESIGSKISLSQKGNVSTIFSQEAEKRRSKKTSKLDLNKFVGILEFDKEKGTVRVGGKTPFKMLTEFLIPQGWCPKIVPELDTITVGGAISGVGIESSSFRHGFVHNTMIEFDVLLGDGRVVTASSQENQDLFRGFAHSYGTFGYILSVKLRLMPASRDVRVVATRMSLRDTIQTMKKEIKHDRADFIEGIVFSKNDALILTATFVTSTTNKGKKDEDRVALPQNGRFKDILTERTSRSPTKTTSFLMSTYDYLWRWDADMFWGTSELPLLGNSIVRACLGRRVLRASVLWWLGQRLKRYSSLFSCSSTKANERERVIQDLGLPFPNAVNFIEQVLQNGHAELPFWLCPARFEGIHEAAKLWYVLFSFFFLFTYHLFCSHTHTHTYSYTPNQLTLTRPPPRGQPKSGGWMLDIASFGSVPRGNVQDKYYHNRALDALLEKLGGGKTFYSDVLYSPEFIHQHFNGQEYDRLKKKYDPNSRFPMLCDKVINKDS